MYKVLHENLDNAPLSSCYAESLDCKYHLLDVFFIFLCGCQLNNFTK